MILALLAAALPWSGAPAWSEEFRAPAGTVAVPGAVRGYSPWPTSVTSRIYVGEEQVYVDAGLLGWEPGTFVQRGGVGLLRAVRMTPEARAVIEAGIVRERSVERLPALAGALRAAGWQSAMLKWAKPIGYGYIEARLKTDENPSAWGGFWLLPSTWGARGEIDVIEIAGTSNVVNQTLHAGAPDDPRRCRLPLRTPGMHTYGLAWSAETMTFYFDRKVTCSFATPAEMRGATFTPIVNLAVGGWAAKSDAATKPMVLTVDYVRAWAPR